MKSINWKAVTSSLRSQFRGKVKSEVPISGLTSFRIGGPARIFVTPDGDDDLEVLDKFLSVDSLGMLVVGRGSNLLLSDVGFDGIVARLGKSFAWIKEGPGVVEAGAAASLPQVANFAARREMSGLEFSIAIPASVGGAVRMNAGAHGRCVADVLTKSRRLSLGKGVESWHGPGDLGMQYRSSNVVATDVIASATFHLKHRPSPQILDEMDAYRIHRAKTQPSEAANAGSMFRNPDGDFAGRLIEAVGLKGLRVGGAEVSQMHANFFLARDGCRAQEVLELMIRVQERVRDAAGVTLIPEVEIVGEFDEPERLTLS